MPELRWTLLILGALFVGILAFWEIRRQRHARGQDVGSQPGRDGERVAPTLDDADASRPAGQEKMRGDSRGLREPTLTFPEIRPEVRGDRPSVVKPPVVELDEASLAELKIEPHTVVDEFSALDPAGRGRAAASGEDPMAGMSSGGPPTNPPTVPLAPAAPLSGTSSTGPRLVPQGLTRMSGWPLTPEPAAVPTQSFPEPVQAEPSIDEGGADQALDTGEPVDSDVGRPVVREASAPSLSAEAFAAADPGAEPVVDWPDESSRKIIALRLVSGSGERFQGRTVRLALAAEGFQLGKFEIFHKPGPDLRAMLSAASLTKPGTFSLGTMDAQRFGGLSLFAVLPGPLSPVETFDELLLTARSLNDRLRGALQDERGEPLTPVRSASIRDSLASSTSNPH